MQAVLPAIHSVILGRRPEDDGVDGKCFDKGRPVGIARHDGVLPMNGGQDLGGMHGFGPVEDPSDAEHFHAEWERRVLAMVIALGACGQWNIDQSRHARESLPPADYMRFPYYRIWLEGVEKLLMERGMVHGEELTSGIASKPAINVPRIMAGGKAWDMLHSLGGAANREPIREAAFAPGDGMTTRNDHPADHTRLPRYARGKKGTITRILGFHVFPDSAGNGGGENPQWLYQVRFAATELWGQGANPRDSVTLDLWEPHLEPA